jgi:hypothetical protein
MTWADASGTTQYVRGRSLDLSASGMQVEVSDAIPLRTYVQVKASQVSLTTTASVRHCVQYRRKYLIGLEFSCPIKTLAERLAKHANKPLKAEGLVRRRWLCCLTLHLQPFLPHLGEFR